MHGMKTQNSTDSYRHSQRGWTELSQIRRSFSVELILIQRRLCMIVSDSCD